MKRLLKVSFVLMLIGLPVLLYQQSRRFYCLPEGRCVTVWKRIGGVCYIVPGKYYGFFKPSNGYIKTGNGGDAVIYWPNAGSSNMIVRIEQEFNIVADREKGVVMEDFYLDSLNNMNKVLYNKQSKRFLDVNAGVELMSINIKEGYAEDRFGKKL